MTPEELPEALKLARVARVAPVPLKVATPSKLYRLAVEALGTSDAATELYRHAMIEAGYMVPTSHAKEGERFEPCDPCPICNWSPTK